MPEPRFIQLYARAVTLHPGTEFWVDRERPRYAQRLAERILRRLTRRDLPEVEVGVRWTTEEARAEEWDLERSDEEREAAEARIVGLAECAIQWSIPRAERWYARRRQTGDA